MAETKQNASMHLILASILGAAVVLIVGSMFWQRMEDDPYIYMRFARNWVEHGEVAFNPGHPLIGFTSLLHFGAVSVLAACTRHLAAAVNLLGLLLHGLSAIAFYYFIVLTAPGERTLPRWIPLVFPLWLACDGIMICSIGMEAGWMALFILSCFMFYFTGRETQALALSGLICWVRPDAALLPPILFIDFVARRRRIPWWPLALCATFAGTLLAFNLIFSGHVLPSTLAAKSAQGLAHLDRTFGEKLFLKGFPRHEKFFGFYLLLFAWIVPFLYAVARERSYRRFGVIPVWALAYAVAYSLLRVPYYYLWYYVPLIVATPMMAALGATYIARSGRWSSARPFWLALAALTAIYPIILLAHCAHDPNMIRRVDLTRGYRAAAEFIKSRLAPEATVATVEIGVLGDELPNPLVDLAAIVTPEIAPHLSRRDFAWPYAQLKPRFVLTHQPSGPAEAPVVDGAMKDRYRLIYDSPYAADQAIRIYQRQND